MSDTKLKCPFCQQELEIWHTNRIRMYACPDLTCKGYYMSATKDMWQELIRTRKALDVAVDEIKKIKVAAESVGIGFFMTAAIVALEKIKTALEQKDK